jgi:DUF4097 and DUF4098 domain-containing protein YvlB
MKIAATLISLCLSATAFAVEHSTDGPVVRVPLSDPTRPAEVRIELGRGDVVVRGTDDASAISFQSDQPMPVERKDGLRVISSNRGGVNVRENDNVVQITLDVSDGKRGLLEVRVPRSASLVVNSSHGGKVGVDNVSGNVEIQNLSGEIALRDLSGGALVQTANGRISAFYTSLPADKPLSFTSMNGEVELRVPAEAKASVRFRTHNGNVLTDFEDAELTTQVESLSPTAMQEMARAAGEAARAAGEAARAAAAAAREQFEKLQKELAERRAKGETVPAEGETGPKPPAPPKPPRAPAIPALSGGKVVTGTLNGGGTEIQIATMNGDIVLRKNAP